MANKILYHTYGNPGESCVRFKKRRHSGHSTIVKTSDSRASKLVDATSISSPTCHEDISDSKVSIGIVSLVELD